MAVRGYHAHMLPRIAGFLVLSTILCAGLSGASWRAQQSQAAPVFRYDFGDEPGGTLGWADHTIDESEWPVPKEGRVLTLTFAPAGAANG